jgi:hypothetical protein
MSLYSQCQQATATKTINDKKVKAAATMKASVEGQAEAMTDKVAVLHLCAQGMFNVTGQCWIFVVTFF